MRWRIGLAVTLLAVLFGAHGATGQTWDPPVECPSGTLWSISDDGCTCETPDIDWGSTVVVDANGVVGDLDGCLENIANCDVLGAPNHCLPGADEDYDGDGDIDADDQAWLDAFLAGEEPSVLEAEVARVVSVQVMSAVRAAPAFTG